MHYNSTITIVVVYYRNTLTMNCHLYVVFVLMLLIFLSFRWQNRARSVHPFDRLCDQTGKTISALSYYLQECGMHLGIKSSLQSRLNVYQMCFVHRAKMIFEILIDIILIRFIYFIMHNINLPFAYITSTMSGNYVWRSR